MAISLYPTLAETVHSYTGLDLAAFFTILALMVGAYRLVSGLFVSPEEAERRIEPVEVPKAAPPPLPTRPSEPVQLGDVTEEELRAYDGSDPGKPLLMAIKGQIYDVSMSRMFYGPGGPYALFAGRDASRALALMSFDPKDLTGNIEGLSSAELETLQDWEYKFMEKYVKVGQLVTGKASNSNIESLRDTEKTEQDLGNKSATQE
ncbi:Membrane steroid-binding protein 2 [Acorus gramineus]|uniref:Membrane steroid-binding protein 2 n=1 Tax=Acorus gramineus TaxID=55184 RepID=A0AAV9BSW3_ACOGR|nr:Membrane steroid-binding protein 2 [Acorus gramineus]